MEKKKTETKENANRNEKLNELKTELLKQVQKRKGIKKEIARILTIDNKPDSSSRIKEKK